MYLRALEIQGFKSFPDKTVLTFGEDITAIVGPNGSGKSNISDAIRWVMGEQSTRTLRGGKMEDVIFGGTQQRKPMGYAEVSLILDNSGYIFNREETEIMVTRRYYRSGESEYYINQRSCRLKDVNELFMDTGLGREGYSIIGQGKIDEILSVKSADRREIFEEAAGISRFRHRKEESERKLQRTSEGLVRIKDKIEELEFQVGPLREQAETARQYLLYRDELRGLEISVWMEQLDALRAGNRKLENDCQEARRQRDEAAAEQERLYQTGEELARQMEKLLLRTEEIRRQISELDTSAGEQESAVAVLKSQIQNNLEQVERLRLEMDQQENRTGSIIQQIQQRRSRLSEIATQRETLEEQLREQQRQTDEYAVSAGTLAAELEELRGREAIQNASAGESRSLLSALTAASQELIDRDTALRGQKQELLEQSNQAKQELKQMRAALNETVEQRDSLNNIIAGYQLRLSSRRKRLDEAKNRESALKLEVQSAASRIKMLSEMEKMYEGYSKSVKTVMQAAGRNQLRNIHGPVADLIRTPAQYTVAIEIALGGAMQNLVVSSEEDGKAAIQYLKRRDGGRATFLPLASIQPRSLRAEGIEKCPGFVGVANDLVECDEKYRTVCRSLLGNVAIAENMDTAIAMARKYRYSFRIVTLDGQVLNVGGSMTGGSVSHSAGILSRKGELEQLNRQQTQMEARLVQAQKELSESQREETAAAYELEVAQNQQRELEDAVLRQEGEVTGVRIKLDELNRQLETREQELEELSQRATQVETDISAAQSRIQELEGEAAAIRAAAESKASGEEQLHVRQEENRQKMAQLQAQNAALEAEEGATCGALEELESLRQDLTADREGRERQIAGYQNKNDGLQKELLKCEIALQQLSAQKAEQEDDARQTAEQRLALEGQRTQADRQAREMNELLLKLERECARLEQKQSAAAMEEKQLLDKLWDSYELSHSDAQALRQEIESVHKANRRIGELKRAISKLGNVNVGAIEQFQMINERYSYFTKQRDDIQQAVTQLTDIISSITGEMETIFRQQFKRISDEFSATFLELFGGGRASLELEDEKDILNCGIEIRVQPPGKSLKIISLLSGGEKAFVAIALYFAILKVRPTPFVVMDEIEAALDDTNVVRFARYLRKLSHRTQFIVITHRRGTMEEADVLYGVTMQDQGISRILTINLNDVERELKLEE